MVLVTLDDFELPRIFLTPGFFSRDACFFAGLEDILGLASSAPVVTGAFSFSAALGVAYDGRQPKAKMAATIKVSGLPIRNFMPTALPETLIVVQMSHIDLAAYQHERWAGTHWAARTRLPLGILAEEVRFELTDTCVSPVFKTGAIDHSATLPVLFRK